MNASAPRCFTCGKLGHKASECPSKTVATAVVTPAPPSTDVKDGAEIEEEIYAPDFDEEANEGLACLTRPTATTSPPTVFEAKCLIQGKPCNVIIDSGCSTNLISQDLVLHFGLPTYPSPAPTTLTWKMPGPQLTSQEHCYFLLKAGKHFESAVRCTVADMPGIHIILGRPWQQRVGACYDGNLWFFTWRGHEFLWRAGEHLKPAPEDPPDEARGRALLSAQEGLMLLKLRPVEIPTRNSPPCILSDRSCQFNYGNSYNVLNVNNNG